MHEQDHDLQCKQAASLKTSHIKDNEDRSTVIAEQTAVIGSIGHERLATSVISLSLLCHHNGNAVAVLLAVGGRSCIP